MIDDQSYSIGSGYMLALGSGRHAQAAVCGSRRDADERYMSYM